MHKFFACASLPWVIGEKRHMHSDLLVKISNVRATLVEIECRIAEADLKRVGNLQRLWAMSLP
jgi:hypothetical protein